jgi:hypothetical protein
LVRSHTEPNNGLSIRLIGPVKYLQTRCKLERPSETYSKQDRNLDTKEYRRAQDSGNDERRGNEKGALRRKERHHGGAQKGGTMSENQNQNQYSIVQLSEKANNCEISMPEPEQSPERKWRRR